MPDEEQIRQARGLRLRMTDAERRLWKELRRDSFGVRFRRQVPLGPYIVDFACFQRRLVIEIDGGQHMGDVEDQARDQWLREQGFQVLRFWNHEVLGNLEGVFEVIASTMNSDWKVRRE